MGLPRAVAVVSAAAAAAATESPLAQHTRPRPYNTGRKRSAASLLHTVWVSRSRQHRRRSTGSLWRDDNSTQFRCARRCCSLSECSNQRACRGDGAIRGAPSPEYPSIPRVAARGGGRECPPRPQSTCLRATGAPRRLIRRACTRCGASRDGEADAERVGDGKEQRRFFELLDLGELQRLRRARVEADVPAEAA
eukprot:scaffold9778_cov111-Isochrysis_galbana.AAC.2